MIARSASMLSVCFFVVALLGSAAAQGEWRKGRELHWERRLCWEHNSAGGSIVGAPCLMFCRTLPPYRSHLLRPGWLDHP
jgi:hypothetical protein